MIRRSSYALALLVASFSSIVTAAPPASPAGPSTRPAGVVLVPSAPSAFAPAIYVSDKASGRVEVADDALRLTTVTPSPEPWQIGANARTAAPVAKGDVLWVTLRARRITSRQETGEAVATVTFMMKDATGREVRPLEYGFACGPEWTTTSLPFVAPEDAAAGAATLSLRFGSAVQSLEASDVTLLNCGPNVALTSLPRTAPTYEGSAVDAPWRAAAAERIERIRKGPLALRVVDAAGMPVVGASVAVRMRRHAFAWGTAIDSKWILDDGSPDAQRYRETVEKYFNKVVFENELKWGRWIEQKPPQRQNIDRTLDWLAARDIAVRGHVMVWPSWRQTPKFLRSFENDPEALRKALADHIAEQTAAYGRRLAEWDVINETFAHNDLMKVLGRGAMVDWFKLARAGAPGVRLFYNDYVMFHGTTPQSPSQYFYDTVRELKDGGAPIDGVGEQGHFGSNPPGPASIVAALDRFGQIGLPIQITEFDIDSPDEQLQADFTRDFTTACFSSPSCAGFVHWGFWSGAHWKPSAALWAKDWTLRPNGQAWVDLVTKTWWTNADGKTDGNGTYATRGFYGDYDVTIERDGRTQTTKLKLSPDAGEQTIRVP